MNTLSRNLLKLAVTTALAVPIGLLAADKPVEGTASHPQERGQTAAPSGNSTQSIQAHRKAQMQAMQARMQAMKKSSDPHARMSMMTAQMQDMQAMMKDMGGGCPMADGQGGMGMMGDGGAGMMGDDMHRGMGRGRPMATPNRSGAIGNPGAK